MYIRQNLVSNSSSTSFVLRIYRDERPESWKDLVTVAQAEDPDAVEYAKEFFKELQWQFEKNDDDPVSLYMDIPADWMGPVVKQYMEEFRDYNDDW